MTEDSVSEVLEFRASHTVLDRRIDIKGGWWAMESDGSFPIRFHLRQVSGQIWQGLLKEGKQVEAVLHATEVVRRRWAIAFSPPNPRYFFPWRMM